MAVSAVASRFEASHGAQVTPLVGREQEIGLLLDRWQQAQEGEGQVVLLSGEPGIGKSRILSTLRDRLEDQSVATLRFQSSPYYVNSAFYPTIDNFERALRFARDESAESKLDKLETLIVTNGIAALGHAYAHLQWSQLLVSFTYTFSFAIVYRQKGAIEDAIEYGRSAVAYGRTWNNPTLRANWLWRGKVTAGSWPVGAR